MKWWIKFMYIWTAIDVDTQLSKQKENVKNIEKEIRFNESDVSLLPLHISLKMSSIVPLEKEHNLISDIENLFTSMHPFFVEVDKVEQNGSIVWIRMKENEELIHLHNELCIISKKHGIDLHEFDKCFVYHTTLFLDNDLEKINIAYKKIKNIELPTKLIASRFVIGSSLTGDIGTYKVDNTIEIT